MKLMNIMQGLTYWSLKQNGQHSVDGIIKRISFDELFYKITIEVCAFHSFHS